MARFLVTYHASEMPHDPEAMAQAREAFMQWAAKTGPALVDPGAPIAGTTTISEAGVTDGAAEGPFQIGRGGVLQINQPVEF